MTDQPMTTCPDPLEIVVPEGTFARMMTDPAAGAPGLRAAVIASRKETR